MRQSLKKKSFDNITVVIVGLSNIARLLRDSNAAAAAKKKINIGHFLNT
jgi:serine/threonine protein phosphatase PrpC